LGLSAAKYTKPAGAVICPHKQKKATSIPITAEILDGTQTFFTRKHIKRIPKHLSQLA
jgi:hypothetical protein